MDRTWTAQLVESELIAAFKALPGTPVYSPVRGALVAALGLRRLTHLDFIMFVQTALGRDSADCQCLMARARIKAAVVKISASEYCHLRGWKRDWYDYHWHAGVIAVAKALEEARNASKRTA